MSSIEQASSVARAAVQLDREGAAGDAAELYGQAARQLHQILQDPSLSDDKRRSLAATQAAYVARAEALRHGGAATAATAPVNSAQRDHDEESPVEINTRGVAAGPLATTTATAVSVPAAGQQDPSLLQLLGTVNREGGKVLVAGCRKAAELNQTYDITGKVAAGATAAVAAVQKANEDYRITERTSAAVSSAYQTAVNANREHRITEKISTVATAAVTKAGEIDREYKITERVGAAFLSSLNYLSNKSQAYLAQQQQQQQQQQPQQNGLPAVPQAPSRAD